MQPETKNVSVPMQFLVVEGNQTYELVNAKTTDPRFFLLFSFKVIDIYCLLFRIVHVRVLISHCYNMSLQENDIKKWSALGHFQTGLMRYRIPLSWMTIISFVTWFIASIFMCTQGSVSPQVKHSEWFLFTLVMYTYPTHASMCGLTTSTVCPFWLAI